MMTTGRLSKWRGLASCCHAGPVWKNFRHSIELFCRFYTDFNKMSSLSAKLVALRCNFVHEFGKLKDWNFTLIPRASRHWKETWMNLRSNPMVREKFPISFDPAWRLLSEPLPFCVEANAQHWVVYRLE